MFYSPKIAKDGSWQMLHGVVNVPADAGKPVMLLSAGAQPTPQDVIWYDDVQVYKIQ